MEKILYICDKCGSSSILWYAWAAWDEENQAMVLNHYFDQTFCKECDGACIVIKTIEEN